MLMFLSILFASVVVLALSCAVFAGVNHETEKPPEARPSLPVVVERPRFFADAAGTRVAQPRIPIEVLLSQIEHHVRLEHAAAESFLDIPTAESLHSRTTSPLLN